MAQTHSTEIKINDTRTGKEDVKDLVEIFSPEAIVRGFSDELYKDNHSKREHLKIMDDYHATAIVHANECTVCKRLHKSALFLIEGYSDERGNEIMQWQFQTGIRFDRS